MPLTTEITDEPIISSSTEGELPSSPKVSAPVAPWRKGFRRWVFGALGAIALIVVASWWIYAQQFESTDDAQIDGHLDAISARISGTVIYINPKVENNQSVEAGTLLLELDPNDYQAELDHAKGELATREGEAHSAGVNVPITQTSAFSHLRVAEAARDEAIAALDAELANLNAAKHKVQEDEAISARAERDRVRYVALVEKQEISRSEYDARETRSEERRVG